GSLLFRFAEPGVEALRQSLLIEEIAYQDDVEALRRCANQIFIGDRDRDIVHMRIETSSGAGEKIDISGEHRLRASLLRRYGHETRAGREVEHPLAAHEMSMIENIARKRLAACPGKGPEGRRQADPTQVLFGLLPG